MERTLAVVVMDNDGSTRVLTSISMDAASQKVKSNPQMIAGGDQTFGWFPDPGEILKAIKCHDQCLHAEGYLKCFGDCMIS